MAKCDAAQYWSHINYQDLANIVDCLLAQYRSALLAQYCSHNIGPMAKCDVAQYRLNTSIPTYNIVHWFNINLRYKPHRPIAEGPNSCQTVKFDTTLNV